MTKVLLKNHFKWKYLIKIIFKDDEVVKKKT